MVSLLHQVITRPIGPRIKIEGRCRGLQKVSAVHSKEFYSVQNHFTHSQVHHHHCNRYIQAYTETKTICDGCIVLSWPVHVLLS